jgi:hypothetical protein
MTKPNINCSDRKQFIVAVEFEMEGMVFFNQNVLQIYFFDLLSLWLTRKNYQLLGLVLTMAKKNSGHVFNGRCFR